MELFQERYSRPTAPFDVKTSKGDTFRFKPYTSIAEIQQMARQMKEAGPSPQMQEYWPGEPESPVFGKVSSLLLTCISVTFEPGSIEHSAPTQLDWLMVAHANEVVFDEIYNQWAVQQYANEARHKVQVIEQSGEDSGAITYLTPVG